VLAALLASQAVADDPIDAGVIKAGLRTAMPAEHGFVDRVVSLANNGTLPPSLVQTTFRWAQKKPAKLRFQYFKRALILRAQDLGITGLTDSSSSP
jgi:hypothetical protein